MTKEEAREANTLHAIWDIIVMHHSVKSALDTYHLDLGDLELVYMKIKEKCDEYRAKGA